MSVNIKDITALTQRLGLEPLKAVGGLSARDILKAVQRPASEPYWKLRYKGACEDVFFLTTIDKIEGLVGVMRRPGRPRPGIPWPTGASTSSRWCRARAATASSTCSTIPAMRARRERVKDLAAAATKALMDSGAFFSRPYGESARMIMNRDAATVDVLKKLKQDLRSERGHEPGEALLLEPQALTG